MSFLELLVDDVAHVPEAGLGGMLGSGQEDAWRQSPSATEHEGSHFSHVGSGFRGRSRGGAPRISTIAAAPEHEGKQDR